MCFVPIPRHRFEAKSDLYDSCVECRYECIHEEQWIVLPYWLLLMCAAGT